MRRAEEKFGMVLLRNLAGVMAIVWMCMIFSFSAQTDEESSVVSESFSYRMVSSTRFFFHWDMSDARVREIANTIEGLVRKAAHMAEYGILSVLLFVWVGQWEIGFLRKWGVAFGMAAVYAATDEIHQLFVPGRAGRFSDVCIDSAGAFFGIIVFALFVKLVRLVKARRQRKLEKAARRD